MGTVSLLSDRNPLEFLSSFDSLWALDDDVRVYATQLTSADPLVLCAVSASCHWLADKGKAIELVVPSACRHLEDMQFFESLPQGINVVNRDTAYPGQAPDSKVLLPIRHLSTADDVNHAVEDFRVNAASYGGWVGGAVNSRLWISLSELLNNAQEHSFSPVGFFAGAWVDDESGPIRLAVVDLGLGVPKHLRRRTKYAHLTDDEAALREAMKEGVSGIDSKERGMGFVHVKKDAQVVSSGRLLIRAGKAQLETRFSRRHESRHSIAVNEFPGTWAYLAASRPRRIDGRRSRR